MSDTTTYPTPAADKLAAEEPRLDAEIAAYREERVSYWTKSFTREQLRDAIEAVGLAMPPKSTSVSLLVEVLVRWDMKSNDDRSPAIRELTEMKRWAVAERMVIEYLGHHVIADVHAKYRGMIERKLGEPMGPSWITDLAVQWEQELALAEAWGRIGHGIRHGEQTPLEAAADARKHYTALILMAARSASHGLGNRSQSMLDNHKLEAYAQFVDKVSLLDVVGF